MRLGDDSYLPYPDSQLFLFSVVVDAAEEDDSVVGQIEVRLIASRGLSRSWIWISLPTRRKMTL
jgi:hypothetical protein